jgi:2-amino-4-hydroxy-6-hydroxymethyldihydropteridine diphosphokinase
MIVYLGLGSNLGDRMGYLQQAVEALDRSGVAITRAASVYETAPVDSPAGSPLFLHTALEARFSASPEELIKTCLKIERAAGRVRTEPNAARTLDIDVIMAGGLTIDRPGLTVPHPRYAERRFVLVPLNEIAPDLVDPARGVTVRELLAACRDDAQVTLYAPPLK